MKRLLALVTSSVATALGAALLAPPAHAGFVYATNAFNDRVDKYDLATGATQGSFGAGVLNDPFGITVAPDGRVVVADTGSNAIRFFAPGGELIQTIPGGLNVAPTDAVFGNDGTLHVTFGGSNAVVTYGPGGEFLSSFSTGPASAPRSVTFGPDGNFYVSLVGDGGDFGRPPGADDRVAVFNAAGVHVRDIGTGGTGPAQFNNPVGVAFNGSDILVLDSHNNRFQRFDATGNFVSQFGSFGFADGQLFFPLGFTKARARIYVANSFDDRIEVYDENGNFVDNFPSNLPTDVAVDDTASDVGPEITSSPSRDATIGDVYAYRPVASGPSEPFTWSLVSGPEGMTVDASTGEVRWTPTELGNFDVALRVTNAAGGFTTQTWTINVGAPAPPTITSVPPTEARVGQSYTYAPVATGEGTPFVWELEEAPVGMTVDPETGVVSWTPDAVGEVQVTLIVTDSAGGLTAQTWTIHVEPATPPATGGISVRKFEDTNGDGTPDAGEPSLSGWEVFVDLNENGVRDAGEPTATTGAEGLVLFDDLAPAVYVVREVGKPGWRPLDAVPAPVLADDVTLVDLPNFKHATIRGLIYADLDGDAARDPGEQGLPGWTVFVDRNGNGAQDADEPSEKTGADGVYDLRGLGPGTVVMRVDVEPGFTVTTPPEEPIEITSGLEETRDFGVARLLNGSILGVKFEDLNGDGNNDVGERRLDGWTIYLDLNGNGVLDGGEPSGLTGSVLPDGNVFFDRLSPGEYVIREVPQPGWAPMEAIRVTVDPNALTTVELPNSRHGSVDGSVYEDRNGDGQRDPGERGLTDWKAFLDLNGNEIPDGFEPSATTGPDGVYHLGELPPSNGVMRVEPQEGFEVTTPPDSGTTITSGAQLTRDFGVRGTGGIIGVKFEDLDNDGQGEEGEPLLEGVQLFLDDSGNGMLDVGEAEATTDGAGRFGFGGLAPGTYTLAEVARPGWRPLEPREITVGPGAPTFVEVPNFKQATVEGFVYNDRNRNQARDGGEPGLENWSVLLDGNDNGTFDAGEQLTATASDGAYSFTGVGPGPAAVVVQPQSGWEGVNIFRFTPTSGGLVTHDFPFVQPLAISELDTVVLSPHDIKVTFTTNRDATAGVELGARTWPEGTPPATNHVVVLSGLEPQTSVVMDVIAEDEDGQTATAQATAETPPLGDFTATLTPSGVNGIAGVPFTAHVANLVTKLTDSQRFVADVYRDMLGRTPDPDAVGFWTGVLVSGTRADVALGLQQTAEFREAVVRGFYTRFLGRVATPEEVDARVASLELGVSQQGVAALLAGSAEYFAQAGGTNEAFVAQLYRDVLDREATPGEAGSLLGALAAGQTREAAALELLTSREELTNVVRGYYLRYLGREPDAGGVAFFVNRLSNERVAAALIGSSEYFDHVAASDDVVARAGTATIETDGRTIAGALERTGANTFRVTVDLNYDAAGTYDVGLTVFDGANVARGDTTAEIRPELGTGASLVPDATDPTRTELRVVGTSGNDAIYLSPRTGGAIRVYLNGTSLGTFSPTGRIAIHGLEGNDEVHVSSRIARSSWLYLGGGNDVGTADGIGNHVLLGGDGDDQLYGEHGRDLLVGGTGADLLNADDGDDILIGGFTTFDANPAALAAILAEWSSERSYGERVRNLSGQSAGGLNFDVFLTPGTTVRSDPSADEALGRAGLDWFLVGPPDTNDRKPDEIIAVLP